MRLIIANKMHNLMRSPVKMHVAGDWVPQKAPTVNLKSFRSTIIRLISVKVMLSAVQSVAN